MKPKQKILEFIRKAYEGAAEGKPDAEAATLSPDDRLAVREMFDGMSTGTARIIIEEEIDSRTAEDYSIADLQNLGRYYAARIVRPDGSAIRRLLVDKQTGKVQFTGR
jgi:hypothetical protein